ncbi:N-formylglutamate amidohydrolase [Rubripirellula lacrimiformis]|uniref:N-formylglutamate amidohydrolase n=1 Tax=Rubripirellula lacrimiformis TaxID=1930273 RepID=A0A517NGM5_9BACT|nr:N-formylglutamate amidohydrolase [Rubripirellula lacrimiformis]QDT06223.1 N-formylglutamate amidohydrolase [Rubripirellula lacrimiformis]
MIAPVVQPIGGISDRAILITCEHGGNEVPPEYAVHFASPGAQADLRSHRGYDPGALVAAESLAKHLGCRLIASTTTRLLVDLNRSESNPGIWSKYCTDLDEPGRDQLLSQYYRPYRADVLQCVSDFVRDGRSVIHLSVHTFTKRFQGDRRDVDLGILFDPDRPSERQWSLRCCQRLEQRLPSTSPKRTAMVAALLPAAGTAIAVDQDADEPTVRRHRRWADHMDAYQVR